MLSLLDTVDSYIVDVWVCFYDHPSRQQSRLWRWLKPGFRHVEVWTLDRGAWARVDPCLEFMLAEVHTAPPWETLPYPGVRYEHVTRIVPRGKIREPFAIGPVTCVELTKAMLGIRAFFVRTPYQLFKYLRKTKC